MTVLLYPLATNRSLPLTAKASGSLNWYEDAEITRTSAPVEALSSVTQPRQLATNRSDPLKAKASGQ